MADQSTNKPKRAQKSKQTVHSDTSEIRLSPGAHALAALGQHSDEAIRRHFAVPSQKRLFEAVTDDALKQLARALEDKWEDSQVAKLIDNYAEALNQSGDIDIAALCRWVRSHVNNIEAVEQCMTFRPPSDYEVIRVLSTAGSQKLVFLATWRLTQRLVVLKRLLTGSIDANIRTQREMRASPLSINHPNIIQTLLDHDLDARPFLVEEYLQHVLNDKWKSNGIQEAANLLYGIADALKHLHDRLKWVHGDIKPDNLGLKDNNYILLDFGLCRPANDIAPDSSATGSLRTRAPEVLIHNRYVDPYGADIWALGATVFNCVAGRFPLTNVDETIPRASSGLPREEFERELRRRAENEWTQRVDLSLIPEPLRAILKGMLDRDPSNRLSANDVIQRAEQSLMAFLRRGSHTQRLSPIDEYEQLITYTSDPSVIQLMPTLVRQRFIEKLNHLKSIEGFSKEQKAQLDTLLTRLG